MKKTRTLFIAAIFGSAFAGCGNNATTVANDFPDKESIDTMLMQNLATNQWDTNIVKHTMKYNVEKKKYDTTDVYLKEQMKMPHP